MSDKRVFVLLNAGIRRRCADWILNSAPIGWVVSICEVSRTLEQNAAQWPYLDAFSKQLKWPVNGEMVVMSPDEWKDVLTAAFQGETVRLAMGMSGGVVMLGLRTSKMGKKRFSEWLEFLKATAAMKAVTVRTEREEVTA